MKIIFNRIIGFLYVVACEFKQLKADNVQNKILNDFFNENEKQKKRIEQLSQALRQEKTKGRLLNKRNKHLLDQNKAMQSTIDQMACDCVKNDIRQIKK